MKLFLIMILMLGTILIGRVEGQTKTTTTNKTAITKPFSMKTVDVTKLKEQIDVVIGKQTRTLALLEDVSTWMGIDPEHPEAVSQGKKLRDFYEQTEFEFKVAGFMYQEISSDICSMIPSCQGDSDFHNMTNLEYTTLRKVNAEYLATTHILYKVAEQQEELRSKRRQLEAMGFEF